MVAPGIVYAQTAKSSQLITPFSSAKSGAQIPGGWIPLGFGTNKPPTEYKLIDDGGITVLHAHAASSSSALVHPLNSELRSTSRLRWRWKISRVIPDADNAVASKEDSPARIVLGFDGDKSKLTFKDKAASALAKTATGRDLPYAQLIYIWSTKAAVGDVIQHPHSKRVKMIVAASGSGNAGKWTMHSRNVYEDFKRAFREEPGSLTEVGVLSDSDNTGSIVDAWYGDIRFVPAGR